MSKRSDRRTAALVSAAVRETARELDTTKSALDTAQAEEIRVAAERLREKRRTGRMIYRLRRHLYPWQAAVIVLAVYSVLWLARMFNPTVAVVGGLVCAAGLAGAAVYWSRKAGQWARRVKIGGVVGPAWGVVSTLTGPSWLMLTLLVLAVVGLSAAYWRSIPIGIKADEDDEKQIQIESIPNLWRQYVANQNGALPESNLWAGDDKDPIKVRYTVQLRRGRETISTALTNIEKISSGIDVPVRNLVLEAIPDSPSQLQLTVVKKSPIKKTVEYSGPRTRGGIILPGAFEDPSVELPQAAVIDIGPYADGEGYSSWRLWTPGEVRGGGSAWGGFIGGGMGIGKSRTLELICIGAMSFGWVETWFLDPQGGASSPALRDAADWYGDVSDARDLLEGLEGFIEIRGKEMGAEGWIGYDPSTERPLLNVVIDECHEVFGIKRDIDRWITVARKIRKVGGAITGLSQYYGLPTFGGREELRSSIFTGNIIAMRSESKHQGQLIPGLTIDPMVLPPIPGYGLTVARAGSSARTAPYRAEYVKDPASWLKKYPGPGLDVLSAAGCGEFYQNRKELAETKRQELRESIELIRSGAVTVIERKRPATPASQQQTTSNTWFPAVDWSTSASKPASVPTQKLRVVPDTGLVDEVSGDNAREIILSFLRVHGQGKKEALQVATGVSETRTRQVLNKLIEQGHVTRADHGWYRLANAKQPVR